jgi:Radical SAM superfamily
MTTRTGYDIVLFADACSLVHSRSMGSYRLATELRRHGFTVKVVDHFSSWLNDVTNLDKLLSLIVDDQTLFFGFSGATFVTTTAEQRGNIQGVEDYILASSSLSVWPLGERKMEIFISYLRRRFPKVKLVYGGGGSHKKIELLKDSVDYIVQGLAENTAIELAKHLSDSSNKLSYFPVGKTKIINHDEHAIGFDFRNHGATIYDQSDILLQNEMLFLETSRGCMFSCGFCDYPMRGRRKTSKDHFKSIDSLAEELKRNYDLAGIEWYSIVDSIFNETTEKLEDVLRARDKSGVDIKFSTFLRYEILAKYPEQIPLLKELGLKSGGLGIESLYTPSARTVGKGTDSEKVKDLLYKLRDQFGENIDIYTSFIIGLPEDNPETLDTWVPWLLDKKCPVWNSGMRIYSLYISERTVFKENLEKYGYTLTHNGTKWKNKYWDSDAAEEYAKIIRKQAWDSGGGTLSGFEFTSVASLGYDQNYLLTTPMKDIPWAELQEKYSQRYKQYQQLTFAYETSKTINSRCEK